MENGLISDGDDSKACFPFLSQTLVLFLFGLGFFPKETSALATLKHSLVSEELMK